MPDKPNINTFNSLEKLLNRIISECSKEDVAEAARLLAMNLAHYQIKYGEMPLEDIDVMSEEYELDDLQIAILCTSAENMIATLTQAKEPDESDDGQHLH